MLLISEMGLLWSSVYFFQACVLAPFLCLRTLKSQLLQILYNRFLPHTKKTCSLAFTKKMYHRRNLTYKFCPSEWRPDLAVSLCTDNERWKILNALESFTSHD
ncbi:uncharacterized protein LY89DRAFT_175368 [Mollisia scopiformis]|uniref:Uncharacterized protein n=1 Tax=Mollisia scopiformis TaxID=149040 RepID=A0A194XSQ4_MOLSC|nr:uncharacterized protein LY89DRAFT_175368 [Mollisia scopiformis]KUJ23228.1 hypothetical protein LY89DRAFT_175368 [Mollisia scopiformis]